VDKTPAGLIARRHDFSGAIGSNRLPVHLVDDQNLITTKVRSDLASRKDRYVPIGACNNDGFTKNVVFDAGATMMPTDCNRSQSNAPVNE
jgi:hypothetical protein